MLIYGTDTGHIGIVCLFLANSKGQFLKRKTVSAKRSQHFFRPICQAYFLTIVTSRLNKSSCTVMKKKVHSDWVLKVKYYESIRSIISCSKDSEDSLVVAKHHLGGSKRWSFTSLPINKGVNCFVYSNFPSVLVTGGTDRNLRLWNVHRLEQPMASLRGHGAPVIDMCVNETHAQIISMSIDKQIKVWDIR